MPEGVHQQPAGVATGARLESERFLGRLDAGLHADEIADVLAELLVQLDQEIHRVVGLAHEARDIRCELATGRLGREIGGEVAFELLPVGEGKKLRRRLDEEIEGIEHRDLGQEIDRDGILDGLLLEDVASQPIAKRVLLPVLEMQVGLHLQRIAGYPHTRVGGRPQADHLRPERDGPVIGVSRNVVQAGQNGHRDPLRGLSA